jgi:alkylation response protein AidB-like acyl-CoA dehydrogenase
MQLLLSEEQKMIRDSAGTLMERVAGAKKLRSLRDGKHGFDKARWKELSESGFLSLMVPEASGGQGLGRFELCLVMQEAGKHLLSDPLAAGAAAAIALADADGDTLKREVLPGVLTGDTLVLPAFQESALSLDPAETTVSAARTGKALTLKGKKRFIGSAAVADGFLVSAKSPEGTVLVYVPSKSRGAAVDVTETVDGCGSGALSMDGVEVPEGYVVAGANRGPEAIARTAEAAVLGVSAELLGIMEAANTIALDYIKTRVQFGRPIGAFQVLQHKAVNQYVEVELTRSLLYQAAQTIDAGNGAPAFFSAVKARASQSALEVTKGSIQLHGAIGFTDEHDIGLYFKRAMALASLWGTAAQHRARFAALADAEGDR